MISIQDADRTWRSISTATTLLVYSFYTIIALQRCADMVSSDKSTYVLLSVLLLCLYTGVTGADVVPAPLLCSVRAVHACISNTGRDVLRIAACTASGEV
jgi:hypothetical protein